MSGKKDFLSNRQNKYSIRRYTFGTTSILLGGILLFGVNNDVKASETSNIKNQNEVSSTSELKPYSISNSTNENGETIVNANNVNVSNESAQTEEGTATKAEEVTNEEETATKVEEVTNEEGTATKPEEVTNEEGTATKVDDISSNNKEYTFRSNFLRSANNTEQPEEREDTLGQNVNNQVNVDKFNFNNQVLYPNNSGYTELSSSFKVEGTVREGDYFTFILPEFLSADGDIDYSNLNNTMILPELKNSAGQIVATGTYNTISKTGKYIFTDFVNNKNNISGQFNIPIFTDRENAPYTDNYELQFNMADKLFSSSLFIDYGDTYQGRSESFGANVTSNITNADIYSGANTYDQTIYVNAKGNNLYNTYVTLLGRHNDGEIDTALLNSQDTNIRIYEVKDPSIITNSYYIDTNNPNYIDVTDEFSNNIIDNKNNTLSINFKNTNKTYAIVVNGKYIDNGENLKTRVVETNTNYFGDTRSTYYWDNEIIVTPGSGIADGDDTDADADADADADENITNSNNNTDKLPESGQSTTAIPLVGSFMTGLGSLLLLLLRRKNIKKNN
ncbi:MAG: fibrinogen-binding adhesin SdrG C-terminal domain-containing protein [Clostridium celatum]|nr:fibrinogen-binding adhesin SdrG C-terminal domain-containing protein [Clostridium celatum]